MKNRNASWQRSAKSLADVKRYGNAKRNFLQTADIMVTFYKIMCGR